MGFGFRDDRLAGFAQINLALHNAISRLFVIAAKNQPATIHEITLSRRDHQKTKGGISFPEIKKGIEVIGQIAGGKYARRWMGGLEIGDGVGGRPQTGRQAHARNAATRAWFGNLQTDTANLIALKPGKNFLGGG